MSTHEKHQFQAEIAQLLDIVSLEPKAASPRTFLDLGKVAVMAEVKLNGKDLGILWKPPYRVDVTSALKKGENQLEIKVVNLWINRQIGDEQLPEDSERRADGFLKTWPAWLKEGKPSPTGRYAFSTWRLWKKGDALVESGLLGPVRVMVEEGEGTLRISTANLASGLALEGSLRARVSGTHKIKGELRNEE